MPATRLMRLLLPPRMASPIFAQGPFKQRLDHCLPADVQLPGSPFQLFQYGRCEINVDSLNGLHHFAGIGEKARNIFPLFGQTDNRLCRGSFASPTSFLHKAPAPVGLPSIMSPGGSTHLPDLADSEGTVGLCCYRPLVVMDPVVRTTRNRAWPLIMRS